MGNTGSRGVLRNNCLKIGNCFLHVNHGYEVERH